MQLVGAGFVKAITSSGITNSITGIPLVKGQAEISVYFLENGDLRLYLANYRTAVVATMPRERAVKLRDYLIQQLGNPLLENRKPAFTNRKVPLLEKIQKPKLSIVDKTDSV